MKYCLLYFLLSAGPLLAQSGSFWNSYPSPSQSSQGGSNQSADGCEWREREITITILGNDELWLNADILTHTCDSEGKSVSYGDYVRIENRGKSPFYYRSSVSGSYENPNTKSFQTGTSSNAYYFELVPNEVRIVNVVEYRNQKEKFLPTHAVLNVKYCKPKNYPTQTSITSLQQFKTKQQQYNNMPSTQVSSSSGANIKSCSSYYFAVVVANYTKYTADYERLPGYLHIYVSNIFKSSVTSMKGEPAWTSNSIAVSVPQCIKTETNFPEFSSQNIIQNLNIPKSIQGAKLGCGDLATLQLYWGDSKEELEKFKRKWATVESYRENFRPSYTGYDGYETFNANSILTFNQNVVCLEN